MPGLRKGQRISRRESTCIPCPSWSQDRIAGEGRLRGLVKRDRGTEKTVPPFPQSSAYRNLSLLKAVQDTTCTPPVYTHTCTTTYVCVNIHKHTYLYTYTHAHTYKHACANTHIYTHSHICRPMHIHMHTCRNIYTHTYAHMHAYKHIYPETHIYTYTCVFRPCANTIFIEGFFCLFFLVLLSSPDSYTDSSLPLLFLIGLLSKSNRWTLSQVEPFTGGPAAWDGVKQAISILVFWNDDE